MTRTIDWTGRVLRVRVGGPAQGGEFVARHEGRVIFCRGGITGEVVEVEIDHDPGRAFCRGTVREVLEPASGRTDPRCPASVAGAGCCDWSHIAPDLARGFSGRILAEQAHRIGRIDLAGETVPVRPPAGDESVTGWRTVARWVTGPDGVPGVRRARSHDLVTRPCTQTDPAIVEAVAAAGVGPHREVIGVLGDDGAVHVAHRRLTDSPRRGDRRGSSRRAAARSRGLHARAGGWETITGPATVVRRVGDRTWGLPLGAFWQAHRSAAAHYSAYVGAAVTEAARPGTEPEVWDLYGGAGLFAASVLDTLPGARVTLVESSSASLGAARTGLGGSPALQCVDARVEEFLGRTDHPGTAARRAPDVVILDPPRGGAGIGVMTRLAEVTRSRIVHVGCDPASLARDVGVLVAAGWHLVDFGGVAAFPGTHHVEGLAVLDSPPTGEGRAVHAVD